MIGGVQKGFYLIVHCRLRERKVEEVRKEFFRA
jgi:hypothetical protein